MSLFKVRTWWTAQCTDIDESYDVASLLCTRFGLEDHEKDYIVIGSHTGLLSVFYPNPDPDPATNFKRSQAADLLLECQLKAPILALLSGRFTGTLRSENTNQLAILHPNNLAIYNLTTVEGVTEHGSHSQLQLVVEHTFARAAFAVCKGHFGQVKGREFFCIGHLDGGLTFYEQDGISYECTLPGPRPLPSAVVYVERTDSFLRVNSSWHLESFSYQDLSHSAINKSDAAPGWSVCLGEGVLDVAVVQVKETSTSILILGERNLIAVNDHGRTEFILKLDYSPKCFYSFIIGYYWEPDARLITAIASENTKLFIYEGPNLIWAAQLEDVPVALQRSNLSNLPGGIVTVGPTGLIKVLYLGSEPHYFQVPPLRLDEVDFEHAHRELLRLEDEIKQAIDLDDVDVVNKMAETDLAVDLQVGVVLNECSFEVPPDLATIPMCGGSLKLKSTVPLEEIQVVISTAEGIRCSLDPLTFNDVAAGMEDELPLQFYLAENLLIETARVEALVSFISKQGIPRVVSKVGYLPLAMLFRADAPQKSASVKLTLNINSKALTPKLATFFPDFCSSDADAQALGLALLQSTATVVTIVTAKNSNRIRVQSESVEALALVLERILNTITEAEALREPDAVIRKGRKAGKKTAAQWAVTASPSIPAAEILRRIDDHRAIQEDIRKQTALMDALWNQFKLFQRSLQSKVDGEPTDGLLMLIERNYDDLVAEGDRLVEMRCAERGRRSNLSCALAVAKQLISCLKLEKKVSNLITSTLVTPVEDWTELSWEESMAPGIDMLHHYAPLNKSKGGAGTAAANADMSHGTFEYDRFRRHFAALFDRVCRLATTAESRKTKDVDDDTNSGFAKALDDTADEEHKTPGKMKKLTKQGRLEALEDDEEEEDDSGGGDGSAPGGRPRSDWLNADVADASDILTNMLLKDNVADNL